MRKKYGIGFFICCIILTLLLVCAYQFSYDRLMRKSKEPLDTVQTKGDVLRDPGYILKEKHGNVIVYLSDGETVYEYTTIDVAQLPEAIRKSIKDGIRIQSLKRVYGFLENYSS